MRNSIFLIFPSAAWPRERTVPTNRKRRLRKTCFMAGRLAHHIAFQHDDIAPMASLPLMRANFIRPNLFDGHRPGIKDLKKARLPICCHSSRLSGKKPATIQRLKGLQWRPFYGRLLVDVRESAESRPFGFASLLNHGLAALAHLDHLDDRDTAVHGKYPALRTFSRPSGPALALTGTRG